MTALLSLKLPGLQNLVNGANPEHVPRDQVQVFLVGSIHFERRNDNFANSLTSLF